MNSRLIFILFICLQACQEPGETILVPDNAVPPYSGVSELLVKNFINRSYIDLLGREPLDTELTRDFDFLSHRDLSLAAIDSMLYRLQYDTIYIEGDSSYRHAYSWQIYSQAKARMLDGESDKNMRYDITQLERKYVKDSLLGDRIGMAFSLREIEKLEAVLNSPKDFRSGKADVSEIYRRMLLNEIYDEINMGSFNYINASFDNLFFRFPTQAEFEAAFEVVEKNQAQIILGEVCDSKQKYAEILARSREFYESSVEASFRSLLGRSANTSERYELLLDFYLDHDYAKLQREIMKRPEYGGFSK